jgi:uncharacterized protein with FMN-binding domain
MRKYLKITIVLSAFFLLVFAKNMKSRNDELRVVVRRQTQQTPTQEVPTTPTGTPNPQTTASLTPIQLTATPVVKVVGKYKDGAYDGTIEDAFYGNLQVRAIIKNGKLADVVPLLYPNDNKTSISINTQAFPMLRDEAIAAQSSQVDVVSGASDSSPAFSRSLAQALKKAQN